MYLGDIFDAGIGFSCIWYCSVSRVYLKKSLVYVMCIGAMTNLRALVYVSVSLWKR